MAMEIHDCPACGRRVAYDLYLSTRPRLHSTDAVQCCHCMRWYSRNVHNDLDGCPYCDCPLGGRTDVATFQCDCCHEIRSIYDGKVTTPKGFTICLPCVFTRMHQLEEARK